MSMRRTWRGACLVAALGNPAAAQTQAGEGTAARLARATSLLDSCARAAGEERKDTAQAMGRRAEREFAELHRAAPADPEILVGQARAISQCLLPFAGGLRAGALYGKSSDLLLRALALDSAHWVARYTLAVNHYRAPSFLGSTDDAIREFETLLRQQRDAAVFPEQAMPYAYLGDLYVRVGRPEDARALQRQLATRDRQKLEEYLTSVREIERRIEKAGQFKEIPDPAIETPAGIPASFQEHIQLMYDMMLLAFQTDTTRIATFLLANDGSNLLVRDGCE